MAQSESDRIRASYEEERRKREGELRERHQIVQLRKQLKAQSDRWPRDSSINLRRLSNAEPVPGMYTYFSCYSTLCGKRNKLPLRCALSADRGHYNRYQSG